MTAHANELLAAAGQVIWDEIDEGIYIMDQSGDIVYWNQTAERITGYTSEEAIQRKQCRFLLLHIDHTGSVLCDGGCPAVRARRERIRIVEDLFLMHKEGYRVPVCVRAILLRNGEGEVIGVMELFRDKSAQIFDHDRIEVLRSMAQLDPLLKIPNRGYLEQNLSIHLDELRRFGTPFGIIFIDIDRFKRINDTYGHANGDLALKTVMNTLVSNSRPLDIVGRWGGEEFLVVASNVTRDSLETLSERYAMLIRASRVAFNSHVTGLTVTIGATIARHEDTIESLVARADGLMYIGKRAGRDRVIVERTDSHSMSLKKSPQS